MSKNKRYFKDPCDYEKYEITKYDNEGYLKNPLLKYRYNEVRERRHFDMLKSKASREKIKLCRHPCDVTDDDVIERFESYYIDKIRESVKKIPVPKMSARIEGKIKGYVPRRLKVKYPEIVKGYMREVHQEFDHLMKNFSVRKILVNPAGADERPSDYKIKKVDFHFHFGRTKNYQLFIRNRKNLQKTLIIIQPFIRCILSLSESDFPSILLDYSKYLATPKDNEPYILNAFVKQSMIDLDKRAYFIRWYWYPKVIQVIKKWYRRRRTLNFNDWPRAFKCMEYLFNRQINKLKIRTLEHLTDVCLKPLQIPRLKLSMEFPNSYVDLNPTYETIEESYVTIAKHIGNVGTNLEPILPLLNPYLAPILSRTLNIELNDVYFEEYCKRLKNCLAVCYTPLKEYLFNFRTKYYVLFGKEMIQELDDFLSKPKKFEEYFRKIESYFTYIDKLRSEPQKEFFQFGVLTTTGAIKGLREMADSLILRVVQQIAVEHIKEENNICKTFENMRDKILTIPKSTEELFKLMEYLASCKTVEMGKLHDRVQICLKIGTELISLTEIDKEHLDLTIKTISWLQAVIEIFEQATNQLETYKFIFEEHLLDTVKKLKDDVINLIPKLEVLNHMSETEKFEEYYSTLKEFLTKITIFDDYIAWINKEELLMKMQKSSYPMLDLVKEYIFTFNELMGLCVRWKRYFNLWMDGPFEYLVPTFVEEIIDTYYKEFFKLQKYYRNKIKQDLVGQPIFKFRGQTEDPDPNNHPVPVRLCNRLMQWIKDFRTGAFIISIMCNPALRRRHWIEMSSVAGFDLTPDAGTTLRKIINMNLQTKLDTFEIISVGANKELQLQMNLHAMIKEWSTIEFPLAGYKDTNVSILANIDDVQAMLDDHIIKTIGMRGSAFMKPCEDEVMAWWDKINRVNNTIDQWGKVQVNYLYLLPIFSSKDIIAQMPDEARLFVAVDQTYKRNVGMLLRQPLVMESGPASGLLESLQKANEQLDDIATGVSNYLEKKRLYFPRMFFLSNDEMLEILSETKDPLRVQPHLSKCFEGVNTLRFDDYKNVDNVLSMVSTDNEVIDFVNLVSTKAAAGSVEKWLVRCEEEMLIAVVNELGKSYHAYKQNKREIWICEWSQMIVLCISQIFWAANVHESLNTKNVENVREFHVQLTKDLNTIVTKVRSPTISNLNRITIKSLIVIDVHAKDVVEELVKNQIRSENDFQWLAQLRYYWEEDVAQVRIINATVPFANEYLGNSDRLVITPLTDRCYRTLVGAYQLHLNGAPEGPAGTGKTETTKDLAKALAVQCKVFNCSDGLDYKAMGKFFKGLAACGAWACFDEFNRIELEVLSVIAQQILSIIVAVRAKAARFIFEGTDLQLNPACYVCITMNPGYAGRSELPDNLKVLFRSVAMMVPDYAMIGEISLYSFGFVNARKLSVKIVTTYKLCSEQLSSQNHYDYGMRAVKTVLQACGNIKKAFPEENEDILLLRCLIDVNLPKFLSFDIPLFEGIISDLFPGITLPEPDYNLLTTSFYAMCNKMNLRPRDSFLVKVIQTYEMMIVRHGFMMVGEPFAGKSITLDVLGKILTELKEAGTKNIYYQHIEMGICNPKSITMGQLYGCFDPISYEWTDGIVATIFRGFAMDPSKNRKWVIFDGPVDAVWIENMNTVLDDNKKLCLNSGEVITMSFEMSMIFEVSDLSQASPATVSRCGMIYMEPYTLGWRTFAESWVRSADKRWAGEGGGELTLKYLDWIIDPAQEFLRKSCAQLLKPGEFSVIRSVFDLMDMYLADALEENPDDYQKYINTWIQISMMFSINWGLGGILDIASRDKFDVFQRKMWAGEIRPYPDGIALDTIIPSDGLLCDYTYFYKQKGAWKAWPDLVRKMEIDDGASGIQIPTIDTARYCQLLYLHIKYHRKLLFVGPTGTGKTAYTQNYMMNKLTDAFIPSFITFTVMITANQVQDLIISKLNKLKRGTFGPPKGCKAIAFIDDMNMPVKEVYGAQPPLELLRQYFDYTYWYDLKDTSKIWLKNLLIICACGLPGGSRQDVYNRFLCHFNIFSINTFSEDTMQKIFVAVLITGYKKNGHHMDVMLSVQQIVSATQQIYRRVQADLRPTPAKSHYIFNLRDISRVITGCSLMKKESVDSKKIFARLWYHEAMRIFYDRLVDEKDQEWMFQKLNDCIKDNFKDKLENFFEKYVQHDGTINLECMNRLIFGTYLDEDSEPDDKKYEEIPSIAVFERIATKNLDEYNSTRRSKMEIALFTYALQHLNKVCRIMSIQGGNALLVGIGGSGRQSLAKLGAQICSLKLFQPEITKNYGVNEWHDDLKLVLKESGGMGRHTAFLITENQIKLELFLQDIDCLLNTGEVPNIYAIDEKQDILELVRLDAQGGNRNIELSILQIYSFFVNRCRQKLHIFLCFSPIGSGLRSRIRLYPSLVNCCTIDWFQIWPEEALQMVAYQYMGNVDLPDETKDSAVQLCRHFHLTANNLIQDFYKQTSRVIYITSASFIELIRSFQGLITRKQKEVREAKMRYVGGLDTLANAAIAIAQMQKDLNALQPKLISLANNSRKMMEEINTETIAASLATEQVKKDEIAATIKAEAAQILKNDCERDLASAIPVLEEAVSALNTLKPADITLVKSMKNPPGVIKLVMAAVCVMKGIPADRVSDPATGKMINDFWAPSKRLLGDINFLQSLKDYDKDNIPPEIMKKIRKEYIPNKDFKPKIIAKASGAAEGLCKWIIAMDLYDNVAKVVAPKKAKLAEAEKEYSETMALLNEKRSMAEALERKVAFLNDELEKANIQMQRTQDEVEFCKNKLTRAESLIGGLGGEKSRWTVAADALQDVYDHLPGDILLSSGYIAYLSALTSPFRIICIDDWSSKCKSLKIPSSDTYSLVQALGTEVVIQTWTMFGLPRDLFSTENGIIMDNSSRYSLFIDPQAQANKWIRNMERNNKLFVVKFSQSDYMKVIEVAIEMGMPVLIENIQQDLEVPLDPILNKNTFIQGGQLYISLGENIIQMSPKFKLYMTSSLRNPHFLPEIFNKVTVINFALTQQGLEDQCLSIVVAKERPDLEELRQGLIAEAAANKSALKNAEDSILKTLSSGGDILENQMAIVLLDESKALSADIAKKQEASKETEVKIEAFRQSYRSVAKHASVLYYTITDLPNVDPMYQFSLMWYINLYVFSIEHAKKSKELNRRIKFLIDGMTQNLYNNVCRSIFEKDKLLYSFVLTTKIMIAEEEIEFVELMFLLTGGSTDSVQKNNPDDTWVSEKMWDDICKVEQIKSLKGFVDSFCGKTEAWREYYDSHEPYNLELPGGWEKKLTNFQKIIVLKAIRPDKVFVGITRFIKMELGDQYVQPPPFDIQRSYSESNCLSPLIFILSPGADPMGSLLLFAERMGYDESFQSISLGQGQGPIAERMMDEAREMGQWVCLQNCHLAASWMPKLEYIWENMDTFNTKGNFRMWLTSYPSDKFPVAMLQNGVKMTNEPPTGLQQNLLRSYASEPVNDEKFYTGCPLQDKAFTRLLYGICFFHAVVQERKKYGPLGWNIPYGFNESDFQISVQQLQMLLNQYEDIPYAALSYLTAECNYGGRVTDAWDRRAIITILAVYVNEDVILDMKYKFSDDDAFILPRKTEHREWIKYIEENIPVMPSPEVYGLHSNAGITRDLNTSNTLLDSMILTLGQVSGGGGEDSDKAALSVIEGIRFRLPPSFDIELSQRAYPVDYNESMNTVLVQEMQRFNRLLNEIRASCIATINGIKGVTVLTPQLETVIIACNFKKTPPTWMKLSYPSLKPLASYVNDFLDRLKWLTTWFNENKPSTFWISGFFFTQAFLTGAMQNFARKYKIPIDTLTFDFEVLHASWKEEPPEDGVYINGIFIEGARWDWDGNYLTEQFPKILINSMPAVQLMPILILELAENNRYKSPMYKTAERRGTLSTTGHSTNYVLPLLLNTIKPASHWIKRSTALICQTSN